MPRALVQLTLCALLLGIGWGGVHWLRAHQPPAPPAPLRVLDRVQVQTLSLALHSPQLQLSGFGSLEAARSAQLASEVAGLLESVSADWRAGSLVKQGQLLWALNTDEVELELRHQEAAIEAAKIASAAARDRGSAAQERARIGRQQLLVLQREEDRWRQLEESGQGLDSRLDRALGERLAGEVILSTALAAATAAEHDLGAARVQQTKAQLALESAQLRLSKSQVLAPFAGYLDREAPAVGTLLMPGQPLTQLHQLEPMRLVLALDEQDVLSLRLGQTARVHLQALPDQALTGAVGAIGLSADARTRTVRVELDLDAIPDAPRLVPGMFGSVQIQAGTLMDVLAIPEAAVVRRRGAPVAFVLVDGKAERRELQLGRRLGSTHVVRSGLAPGEQLILGPLPNLSHGSSVVAANRSEPQ
ncbi:MAG: RND family efflux transporter MFP subunit [Planctomycetota bacterium]|jgi:RND family efflux transporter MFP subunit